MTSFLAAVRKNGFTNKNIVAVGDSITFGFGASSNATIYHAVAAASFGASSINKGHNGSGWIYDGGAGGAGSLPSLAAEVDAVLTVGSPQTLILFAGTNDFAFTANDAPTVFAAMMNYRAARVAAGYSASSIIVPTMLPRDGLETIRTTYNGLIVSSAASYGYAVARFDLDPHIGVAGANDSNPTYYYDTIHPNDAGHAIMATIIEGLMA